MSAVAGRYTLKVPIRTVVRQGEGELITELTVRRPIVRDLLATYDAKGDVGKALALLARLTGVDRNTLANLDGSDFEALSHLVDVSDAPAVEAGAG